MFGPMANGLDIQLVNGLSGDPAVSITFTQAGESLLFDAGSLDSLSNREVLKIRVVAVSHTHVDHFIGFDRLLRVNVPHFRLVEVVGPPHITSQVQAKLKAYTWNLLEPDQITFIVHEVERDGTVRSAKLSNNDNFTIQTLHITPGHLGVALIPLQSKDFYFLRATVVDHGTDVLAYELKLPDSMTVSKEALSQSGLSSGPWIAQLQKMAGQGSLTGDMVIDGQTHDVEQLATKILRPRSGGSIIYVTDMQFNARNLAAIKNLVSSGVDCLICETNYRAQDRAKAVAKAHLTTRQAALIAASIGAKELQIFHVSNIYAGDIEVSQRESQEFLTEARAYSPENLMKACRLEFPH
jgi:ribonuclease Z